MLDLSYPDSGHPLEDASILRNAVYFSTAERAYSAELILKQPMNVNQLVLDFLAVRAFEEFMTSTEDLIGWFFALQEWKPGNAEYSLYILLDKIQVGRNQYREDNAVNLLSSANAEDFRKLFHIPTDEELSDSGISKELVVNIKRSLPFKLDGWRKMATRRVEQDRGWVLMFNKIKHHMLAFPTQERGKSEIWMPCSTRMNKEKNEVRLKRGWLEASANELRRLVSDAVAAQAVLHDTLATILITRYGERYSVPDWVIRVYQTYL